MTEQMKYEIIKNLVETDGNKDGAAIKIGFTIRHINRLIKGYKEHGKAFFVHENRGRKPAHTLSDETRQTIIDLYRTKYYDANFSFYAELLAKYQGIQVSSTTIRSLLMAEGIVSPRATRATKKSFDFSWKNRRKRQLQRRRLSGLTGI